MHTHVSCIHMRVTHTNTHSMHTPHDDDKDEDDDGHGDDGE